MRRYLIAAIVLFGFAFSAQAVFFNVPPIDPGLPFKIALSNYQADPVSSAITVTLQSPDVRFTAVPDVCTQDPASRPAPQ